MTSFTNLPEQVITSVCGDWLNAKSVGSLDTAVSNSKMRPHFLAALRNAPISCHKVLCSKPMYPNDMKYYVMLFSFCNWFQKRVQWEEHVKSMAATIDLSHDHATIIQALEAAGIALGQYDFVYGVNIDINAFADGTDYGKRLSWFISHFPLAREMYVQVPKFEVAPTTQICNVLNNNPRFGRIYFDFVRDFESACAQFENNRQSDCFRPIRYYSCGQTIDMCIIELTSLFLFLSTIESALYPSCVCATFPSTLWIFVRTLRAPLLSVLVAYACSTGFLMSST